MMLLYLPLAIFTLVYTLYYYFSRTFNHWKRRGIVGPEPVPFFGNLRESFFRRKNLGVLFRQLYKEFPNEKVIGIYRMTTPSLLLRDLDVIKHVMVKDYDNFVDRGIAFSKEGLGSNLFHSDGDTWKVLRNRFTPLFTTGKLKNMLHLMIERGENLLKYVGQECSLQPEQEVHTLVQKYTMSTIAACAFGLDIDTLCSDTMYKLKKVDKLALSPTFARELDMMYPGILMKLNSSLFPSFVKTFFSDLMGKVVLERINLPGYRKDYMDFIDLMIIMRRQGEVYGNERNVGDKQLSVKITDDLIDAQALAFYVGGYATSAATMGFLLYELAKNPDIQEKLHEHISEVLKNHDGKMTYEALQDMTYLEHAFDETLRLYPIEDPLQRLSRDDYKVPGTNIVIEKGTIVLVSAYGVHHDPKYYPDPEKFDPERFTVENSRGRHSCAYLPFGVGPRHCMGMRFAKIQSRVCISKLLSQFRVEVSENTPDIVNIDPKRSIMGAKNGLPLRIVRR